MDSRFLSTAKRGLGISPHGHDPHCASEYWPNWICSGTHRRESTTGPGTPFQIYIPGTGLLSDQNVRDSRCKSLEFDMGKSSFRIWLYAGWAFNSPLTTWWLLQRPGLPILTGRSAVKDLLQESSRPGGWGGVYPESLRRLSRRQKPESAGARLLR